MRGNMRREKLKALCGVVFLYRSNENTTTIPAFLHTYLSKYSIELQVNRQTDTKIDSIFVMAGDYPPTCFLPTYSYMYTELFVSVLLALVLVLVVAIEVEVM